MFFYTNIDNNDPHQKKTTNTFLYIQKQKILKRLYIYKNLNTFQKSRQVVLGFYSKKLQILYITQLSWNFWIWHLYIYKNHDYLRYVKFLYTKSHTLGNKQDNLRYIFFIKKSWHFALHNFSWNFWNLAERGVFFYTKNNALCVKFLYEKTMYFSLHLYVQKSRHFASHFYFQKTMHFELRFYI